MPKSRKHQWGFGIVLAIYALSCFAELPERPNILLIVADDMAYTDIGAYGGDIVTPNLDRLAAEGITFSRFYAAPTCSPTRSMLMSGTDNHIAGIGTMAGPVAPNQEALPGYEGYLNERVVSLANLMKEGGYHTYMSGKWHLGLEPGQLPSDRGFEKTFVNLGGGSSHFSDMTGAFGIGRAQYSENGVMVEQLPDDFFSTRYYTDRMIDFIDDNEGDGRPFFAYLAYTAPHLPLQAPDDIIDKYAGAYDEGYDGLRQRRFAGIADTEILPEGATIPERLPYVEPWEDLDADQKAASARTMEVYAAMVDDMDMNVGRVLDYLRTSGQYDNTLVIFISDNGGDPTSETQGLGPMFWKNAERFDNSIENMGRVGSLIAYRHTWAAAGGAPFNWFKSTAAEGGIRVPGIISWPAADLEPRINHAIVSVMDVLPTALDLAGIEPAGTEWHGRPVELPQGKSLRPVIEGTAEAIRDPETDYIGIEVWSSRAIIKGDWKLLGLYDGSNGLHEWQLFNLADDSAEQVDLSMKESERFSELLADWDDYAESNGVVIADPGVPGLMRLAVPSGN
jgi:arylsulfatase A-like enzyme